MLSRMNRANGKILTVMDTATTKTASRATNAALLPETAQCRPMVASTAMVMIGLMNTMLSKTMTRNGMTWMATATVMKWMETLLTNVQINLEHPFEV